MEVGYDLLVALCTDVLQVTEGSSISGMNGCRALFRARIGWVSLGCRAIRSMIIGRAFSMEAMRSSVSSMGCGCVLGSIVRLFLSFPARHR